MPAKSKENRDKGQFVAELMVAMTVMIIGLLGAFALLSQSLGLARVVANQYAAANLAAEGIEVVKNIVDTDFISGQPFNASIKASKSGVQEYGVQYNGGSLNSSWKDQPLKFDSSRGIYSYDAGTPTRFIRTIQVQTLTDDEIQVNSIVKWQERGGREMSVNLEDHFYSRQK